MKQISKCQNFSAILSMVSSWCLQGHILIFAYCFEFLVFAFYPIVEKHNKSH